MSEIRVEDLNDNQRAILKTMLVEARYTGYAADEVVWPHRTFERVNGMEYKTISKEMKVLRDAGFVYYVKSGLTEDGEVAGAGNGIDPSRSSDVYDYFADEIDEL